MPTFESSDNDLEFEFSLAAKLHKTVGEMRKLMTNKEYLYWSVYWGRRAQEQELAKQKAGI